MPDFRYRAVDRAGTASEGTMTADSARDIVESLKEKGLTVSSVTLVETSARIPVREKKLTWDDLNVFNEQALAILKSGLPFSSSLKVLASDIQNRRLRPVLDDIHQSLDRGDTLDDALSRHPKSFSPVYRALIRTGEETGNLPGVFETLTAYSSRNMELKNRLQESMAYPVLVFVVALVLIGYVLFELLPGLAGAAGGGVLTPAFLFGPTDLENIGSYGKLLTDILSFLYAHRIVAYLAVVGILFLIPATLALLRQTTWGRGLVDALLLRLPVWGKVIYSVSVARFARALAMLFMARAPAPDSLRLAGSSAGNTKLLAAARHAAASVESGLALSESLSATGFFSKSFCWLVRTGEDRNSVEQTLLDFASQAEARAEQRMRTLVSMGGPALIACSAVLVGLVVLLIYGFMYLALGFHLGSAISR